MVILPVLQPSTTRQEGIFRVLIPSQEEKEFIFNTVMSNNIFLQNLENNEARKFYITMHLINT